MNRERAKELLPIIQAYADGKDIEYKSDCFPSKWVCVNDLMGEIGETSGQYRIKPEPRVFWINPSDRSQSPRTGCWMTQEEYDQEEYETDKFATKGYIKVIEDLSDD